MRDLETIKYENAFETKILEINIGLKTIYDVDLAKRMLNNSFKDVEFKVVNNTDKKYKEDKFTLIARVKFENKYFSQDLREIARDLKQECVSYTIGGTHGFLVWTVKPYYTFDWSEFKQFKDY